MKYLSDFDICVLLFVWRLPMALVLLHSLLQALLQSVGSGDLDEQSFVAVADYLKFKPEKWSECGWTVEATKTPIVG